MANFSKAFDITMGHEGGYSFDPDDAGGETYRGISRIYHPSWPGWKFIDDCKELLGGNQKAIKKYLSSNSEILEKEEKHFYKAMYWDRFWGDYIPNQSIAEELFDTSVNMGVGRSVKFLQESLNILNRNQKNYPDILEDGLFGRKTLNTLKVFLELEKGNPKNLLKVMNIKQGIHYIDYMERKPSQEKYARGWLNRVEISKKNRQK